MIKKEDNMILINILITYFKNVGWFENKDECIIVFCNNIILFYILFYIGFNWK